MVPVRALLYAIRGTIDEWLSPYRRMWAVSLDDLERHLERMSD